ncbi:unnamed protein product [Meloidogyne enterolobii]|uniref:Uncharacterized protein n=3 Tax=Meloidogyne TaxID=189290 RepID=A0ACB0Y2T0_MELEN|nr:unnamed protein product [Meloidogyne enterolobii]
MKLFNNNFLLFLFISSVIFLQILARPSSKLKRSSLGGVDLRLPYRFIPNNLLIENNRFRRSQPLLPPLIADQSTVINDDFSLEPFIVSTWEDGKR